MTRTGVRLRELAARWCDAATLERYLDPVLADLQAEYEDAVRRGRAWQSRWIWIRGHAAFLTTVVCCGGGQVMRMLQALSAGDRTALRRTVGWGSAVIIVGTLVLVAAPFQSIAEADRRDAAESILYLVPQALAVSVPLGLTLGVLWGMGRSGVSWQSRAAVLIAAAALSATVLGITGWLAPASNQAFRVAIVEGHVRRDGHVLMGGIPKGVNELTLGELRRLLRSPDPRWPLLHDVRTLALNYQRRWAIAAVPLVLSFFVLVVIGSGHRTRLMLSLATVVVVFGYLWLVSAADKDWLPAVVAAWTPNAVFVVASMTGILMRSPRSTPHTA